MRRIVINSSIVTLVVSVVACGIVLESREVYATAWLTVPRFRNLQQVGTAGEQQKSGILEGINRIAGLLLPAKQRQVEISDASGIEAVSPIGGHGFDDDDPDYLENDGGCPDRCQNHWIGDGWCDSDCAFEGCDDDGGDCDGWCAPDCKPQWVGDGNCDLPCFREECKFDKDDCSQGFHERNVTVPLVKNSKFDYTECPTTCSLKSQVHNQYCDEECNLPECNFDGGDCFLQCAPDCARAWLGDGDCDDPCNVESCGYDKGDCKQCAPGCNGSMVGNGICDSACNNSECAHDAGDCHGVCWASETVDYATEPFIFPHCRSEWRGDGYCDCFCLNSECDFDFGDCDGHDCTDMLRALATLNQRTNSTLPGLSGTAQEAVSTPRPPSLR